MNAPRTAAARGGAARGAALFASVLLASGAVAPFTGVAEARQSPAGFGGRRGGDGGHGKDWDDKDPSRALLRRMVDAEMRQAYVAREATFTADGPGTEQWVKHDPRRGVRRESIRPPGLIFIDNFKKLWRTSRPGSPFIESDSLLTKKDGRRMQDFAKRLFGRKLNVQIVGQDRVAGRTADIVTVSGPEGTAGPYRRFWVDRETGLRLRTEEVGPQGRVLSGSYYLSLDLSPTFEEDDFRPPAGVKVVRDDHKRFPTLEAAAKAGVTPRTPAYLPAGFALRQVDVAKQGKIVTVRYANGLNALSLAESQEGLPGFLRSKLGSDGSGFVPLPRGQRGYIWQSDGRTYFLIGGLSEDELKRIADSVR
jgi:hypothetical protein